MSNSRRNLFFDNLEIFFWSKITLEINHFRTDIVLFQKDKYFNPPGDERWQKPSGCCVLQNPWRRKIENYGADALPAMMANRNRARTRHQHFQNRRRPERAEVVEFESVEAAQKATIVVYQAAKKLAEVDRMLFVIEEAEDPNLKSP